MYGADRLDFDRAAAPAQLSAGGIPERTVLELLYEIDFEQGLEEACNVVVDFASPTVATCV